MISPRKHNETPQADNFVTRAGPKIKSTKGYTNQKARRSSYIYDHDYWETPEDYISTTNKANENPGFNKKMIALVVVCMVIVLVITIVAVTRYRRIRARQKAAAEAKASGGQQEDVVLDDLPPVERRESSRESLEVIPEYSRYVQGAGPGEAGDVIDPARPPPSYRPWYN